MRWSSCGVRFHNPIRGRLVVGDQVVGAIADQVAATHGLERIAQQGPVVGSW